MSRAAGGAILDLDGLIVDLDGVVWVGEETVPGSAAALAELRARGVGLVFLTNDPSGSRAEYRVKKFGHFRRGIGWTPPGRRPADTTEVDSNTTTLGIAVEDVRTVLAGEDLPSAVSVPQQVHLEPDGTPRELVTLAASEDGSLFYFLDLIYPVVRTGKTAQGDTWQIEFEAALPAATGTSSYSGTGELIGFDDIDGVRVAEVRNELSFRYAFAVSASEISRMSGLGVVSSGTIEVDGTGLVTVTAWIDPRTGGMLRAESEGTYDLTYVYDDFDTNEVAFENGTIQVEGRFRSALELVG